MLDLAFPYSGVHCGPERPVSGKGEEDCPTAFPETGLPFGAWMDLEYPPPDEEEALKG